MLNRTHFPEFFPFEDRTDMRPLSKLGVTSLRYHLIDQGSIYFFNCTLVNAKEKNIQEPRPPHEDSFCHTLVGRSLLDYLFLVVLVVGLGLSFLQG